MEVAEMTRSELKDDMFMRAALNIMNLSTCRRRKVGCILVDDQYRMIGSGVNGVPKGWVHCVDEPCIAAQLPSGVGLDLCEAIHAEQNALIQCTRPDDVWTAYCTTSPCSHCVKMLANTGCVRILFKEEYVDKEAAKLWSRGHVVSGVYPHNRVWVQI
jgi:dCMP deaminase